MPSKVKRCSHIFIPMHSEALDSDAEVCIKCHQWFMDEDFELALEEPFKRKK